VNFTIRTNVIWETLVHAETGQIHEHVDIDSEMPDELIALLLQYPNLDPASARELYEAGIPIEEIAPSPGR
jgi:hypothetical protein